MSRRLLLLSGSKCYHPDTKYAGLLDHAEEQIKNFLGEDVRRIGFVPYARPGGMSFDDYTAKVRERFGRMGYEIVSVHEDNPEKILVTTDAIFIGGGNTFRLLDGLYEANLLDVIRARVNTEDIPYIGSSAGSNVACPTIKTTNDMPIVQPKSLKALGLVPFQINPHYIDPDTTSKHMGETREQRIQEFYTVESNTAPVVALREGTMLLVIGQRVNLEEGKTPSPRGARIFYQKKEPEEFVPPAILDFLLD